MKQYFEFKDDKSSKFWEITQSNKTVITRYGKLGTDGQTSKKNLGTEGAAQKEYDKLVREKTKKGYKEITTQASSPKIISKNKNIEPKIINYPQTQIAKLFSDYNDWYVEKYLPKLIKSYGGENEEEDREILKEFKKDGWMTPIGKMKPFDPKVLKSFEEANAALPSVYKEFLLKIGCGDLLCATNDDPYYQEFIHPKNFARERKNMLRWLSPEAVETVKKKFDFDSKTFIPFLKIDDACWAFLSNSTKSNNQVYVFDHGFEGGYKEIFCSQKVFTTFFENYFKRIFKKNPINPNNCWRSA